MANRNLDSEIRSTIDVFVEDVTKLVKQAALESVRDALSDGAGPARRGRKPGPGRPRGRKARGRSSVDYEAVSSAVLDHVRGHPDQRLEEIATGMGKPTSDLKVAVRKMVLAKQLRKRGEKRGARYSVGTGSARSSPRKKGRRRKKA